MNKFMNEHLKKINSEDENFKNIKNKLNKQKKAKVKLINVAAIFLIVVLLGTTSPKIYAKFQQNMKYKEYTRRNYVSGKGEIASAYSENIDMDYVYQNDIGVKVDSIVLTDDSFKANINMKLPEAMRVDKLPENDKDGINISYQFGYAVYDENNNILDCMTRIDEESYIGGYQDYLMCLCKELGIKFNKYNLHDKILAKSGGYTRVERDNDKVINQINLSSLKGFPNSQKIYIRIFNIGYSVSKYGEPEIFSKHNDLEWIFEIETPDKFLKRETLKLVLLDEIPKLKVENFTLSETGMVLQAEKKDVVETMGAGKDMDNWEKVSNALLNITDDEGNIYYPVEGGTTGGKKGFYGRFEIDKDLFDDSTFYLNMKIGEEEYTSEIAVEE